MPDMTNIDIIANAIDNVATPEERVRLRAWAKSGMPVVCGERAMDRHTERGRIFVASLSCYATGTGPFHCAKELPSNSYEFAHRMGEFIGHTWQEYTKVLATMTEGDIRTAVLRALT